MSTFDNTLMVPADEKELGQAFLREIRREIDVIDDVEINEYFNTLAYRLASYSSNPQQFFLFFIVKEPMINAFAFPDGFIGFNSGLILNSQTEEELASVLAHEIAHVNQRHGARRDESLSKLALPSIAASLASILLGGAAGPALISAAYMQTYLDFTRAHEKEADSVGMQTLSNAGFNPHGMPSFFERLQQKNRYRTGEMPEFLRTHPVTANRIADARARAEQLPKKAVKDTPHYHLMKAKLLVLTSENPKKLEKDLQTMLETGRYRDERAVRYALALVLLKNQKIEGVQTHIDWLLNNDSDRLIYQLLRAKLSALQKDNAKATKIYEEILRIYPQNFLGSLAYAEHLLQINDFKKAKTVLLAVTTDNNPEYYHLLSQAYEKLGEKAEAYLALAEYHYMKGQLNTAFEQLRQARQQKELDFYMASRIEARYKVIEAEFHEQQNFKLQKQAENRQREEQARIESEREEIQRREMADRTEALERERAEKTKQKRDLESSKKVEKHQSKRKVQGKRNREREEKRQ